MSEYISAIGLPKLLSKLGSSIIGVEIGVCEATSTKYLLDTCSNITMLYGVDPWEPYSDDLSSNITQEEQDKNYNTAITKLYSYQDRINILKCRSAEAAQYFENGSLDFIFIDGSHTYEHVITDLKNWYPKLKPSGLLSGHDFGVPSVYQALKDFGYTLGLVYHPLENSAWYAEHLIYKTTI